MKEKLEKSYEEKIEKGLRLEHVRNTRERDFKAIFVPFFSLEVAYIWDAPTNGFGD